MTRWSWVNLVMRVDLVARGEIWLVNLDPTVGSEIVKTRPCLVVSPAEMHDNLRTVIVAPDDHGEPTGAFSCWRDPCRGKGSDSVGSPAHGEKDPVNEKTGSSLGKNAHYGIEHPPGNLRGIDPAVHY